MIAMTHKEQLASLRQAAIDASLLPENKGKWMSALKTEFGSMAVWRSDTIKEAQNSTKWRTAIHAKNGKVRGEVDCPVPTPESAEMTAYRAALLELDLWHNAEKAKIDTEYELWLKALYDKKGDKS